MKGNFRNYRVFGNWCKLKIVSSLKRILKGNKQGFGPNVGPAQFGPMAGPQAVELAPLTWACPVSVRTGPITRARELSAIGATHWACPMSGRSGPMISARVQASRRSRG